MSRKAEITLNSITKTIPFKNDSYAELDKACDREFKLNGEAIKHFKLKKGNESKVVKTTEGLMDIIRNEGKIRGELILLTNKNSSKLSFEQNTETSKSETIKINVDKTRSLIEDQFKKMQAKIDLAKRKAKQREAKLDKIISMLQNQSWDPSSIMNESIDDDDDDDDFNGNEDQTYQKPKPTSTTRTGQNKSTDNKDDQIGRGPGSTKEVQPKTFSVQWTNKKNSLKISSSKNATFLVKAINDGESSWPKKIELYCLPKSTIRFEPEVTQMVIKKAEEFTKNIYFQTKGLKENNYVAYAQFRSCQTQENFGSPLKIDIQILSNISEEEKQNIRKTLKNDFEDMTEKKILEVCEKHSYDQDAIWSELQDTVIK